MPTLPRLRKRPYTELPRRSGVGFVPSPNTALGFLLPRIR